MRYFILLLSSLAVLALCGQGSCSNDADGDGWSTVDGDCDDNDADVHPGATEACDDVDNNCDGEIDEGCTASTCPLDGCWVDWWGEYYYLEEANDGTIVGTMEISSCTWDVDGYQDETTSPAVVLDLDLQGESSSCADFATAELDWSGTDCTLLVGILYAFDIEQQMEMYPCSSTSARSAAPSHGSSPLTRAAD